MDELNWIYDGQQYSLITAHGKAIIEEVLDAAKARVIGASDRHKYLPRIELSDGTVRKPSRFYEFDDFESAEAFLLYHELAPLDSNSQLSETVQYCTQLLLKNNVHPSHFLRLQFVAKTLELAEPLSRDKLEFSAKRDEVPELTWQKTNTHYFVETHHGKVVIIEQRGRKSRRYGGSDSYQPVLYHGTGAALRGPRFHTFEAAEQWITSALRQLDHPMGGKVDVNNVEFTLDICIKLLPKDSEPMHYVRINRMKADYSGIIL